MRKLESSSERNIDVAASPQISIDKPRDLGIGSLYFGSTRHLAGFRRPRSLASPGRLISTEHLCYFHREFRAEFIRARDAMEINSTRERSISSFGLVAHLTVLARANATDLSSPLLSSLLSLSLIASLFNKYIHARASPTKRGGNSTRSSFRR